MENIEKMIKENSELFMDQEPSEGHFERFEKRLARQNGRKRVIGLVYRVSRVAAVGLLLIMSSLWVYNEFISPEERYMKLSDAGQEYREVEFFLTSQINSKYEELSQYDFSEDEAFKESMLEEVSNMDSVYLHLQKELGSHPGDERILEAMIRHYQTKLAVISQILEQMKSYKEISNPQSNKNNQYESVEL